jgi:hypothetical protein
MTRRNCSPLESGGSGSPCTHATEPSGRRGGGGEFEIAVWVARTIARGPSIDCAKRKGYQHDRLIGPFTLQNAQDGRLALLLQLGSDVDRSTRNFHLPLPILVTRLLDNHYVLSGSDVNG